MSLPPHREKDAKAEGRGPPETVTETTTPFRNLLGRLLKVPMDEVKEQQKLYEQTRDLPVVKVRKKVSAALQTGTATAEKASQASRKA